MRGPEGLPPGLIPVAAEEIDLLRASVEQLVPFASEVVKGCIAGVNFGVQECGGLAVFHAQGCAFRAAAVTLSLRIKCSAAHLFQNTFHRIDRGG